MSATIYVESSALARVLVEGDRELGQAIASSACVTSALTLLETSRAIGNAQRQRRLSAVDARGALRRLASFERQVDVFAITGEVIQRARQPFPVEHVRSLDAIHLASAVILDQETPGGLTVASCDDRVRENARDLGFSLVPADDT